MRLYTGQPPKQETKEKFDVLDRVFIFFFFVNSMTPLILHIII